MKHKNLVIIAAILVIGTIFTSCTRSATGGPTDSATTSEELPNPVATDSQIMKDIIAGTRTAMAVSLDEEESEEADTTDAEEADTEDSADVETTPEPEEEEEEAIVLPTSTAGPPPVVELNYNVSGCQPGYYICEVEVVSDQKVTLQSAHPYLYKDEDLTFTMGPEGEYDYSKYIVAGTAKYTPGENGSNFEVTLNIPDALRGVNQIVVRLETKDPNRYGMIFFDN